MNVFDLSKFYRKDYWSTLATKFDNMNRICTIVAVLLFGMWAMPAYSQYDDIYYNPDTDQSYYSYDNNNTGDSYYGSRNTSRARQEEIDRYYDADEYDYYNDYDFYYTSRIRRFHRPMYGFGYYDPVYVDAYYYDPFVVPGNTVLIYDDFFSYRDWVRWRRWNNWGWNATRFNNWAFCYQPGFRNAGWGWDPFWSNRWFGGSRFSVAIGFGNFGFNRWGFNPYGFNTWGFGGYGNGWFNAYPRGYWAGGNYNYAPGWSNGDQYDRDIYYGPRSGGSGSGPDPGLRNRRNGINPGSIGNNGRITDTRRDLDERATPRNGQERVRIGDQSRIGRTSDRTTNDRIRVTDPNRNERIDRNTTTPTRIRTTTPRTRTNTAAPRTRTNTGSTGSTNGRSRSGNNEQMERRQIGGQIVPVTPTTPDRLERYRRPTRSGAVRTQPDRTRSTYDPFGRSRSSSSRYDRSRTTRTPSYDRSRSSRTSRVRSTSPSRSRSSVGSSSRSRSSSSAGRSRSSSSSRSKSGSSSSSGRKRGNN